VLFSPTSSLLFMLGLFIVSLLGVRHLAQLYLLVRPVRNYVNCQKEKWVDTSPGEVCLAEFTSNTRWHSKPENSTATAMGLRRTHDRLLPVVFSGRWRNVKHHEQCLKARDQAVG
jgi:hypothetical protein